MKYRYNTHRDIATSAAKRAGKLLRAEFHRGKGPRGTRNHALVDEKAESFVYEAVTENFPDYGYLGEELGRKRSSANSEKHLWLVDPNDGTSAYMRGFRGAAVSIALLRNGKPVLGVVYAFNYPDDSGDLISWMQDGPVMRNGLALKREWSSAPTQEQTVLLSQSADKNPEANAQLVEPMRYRPVPSIAYRLALVAVGDGDVAISLNGPTGWDYAAGHAILMGAGGDLFNSDGEPIRYSSKGESQNSGYVFGGTWNLVRGLINREWESVFERPEKCDPYFLIWPFSGRSVDDSELLSRAQGCLLGQFSGDALGSLVEFQGAGDIKAQYPDGCRVLQDGGTWDTLAGQPTDDSEMALMLARTIVKNGSFDANGVSQAYDWWYNSEPFDMGSTISQALDHVPVDRKYTDRSADFARGAANRESQANGAMMRISPLGVFGASASLDQVTQWARDDASLTHPHPLCQNANALFAMAIAFGIKEGPSLGELYERILQWAKEMNVDSGLHQVINEAADHPPEDYSLHQGWVLIAFQNALYQLLHAESLEAGVVDTVRRGGDTDTNAAICGALLGSIHGRRAIPSQWINRILSCRPIKGLAGVNQPRPEAFWPVDVLFLAEQLIVAGRQLPCGRQSD